MDSIEIGKTLKRKRKELRLTQSEVAKKIQLYNGTSITRIEKGSFQISVSTLEKYCKLFNCKASDILNF